MAKKKAVEFDPETLAQMIHSNEVRANIKAERERCEAIRRAGIEALEKARTFA